MDLPLSFISVFFDIVGNDLLNSLKAAYGNGEMSISQRRGSNNNDPQEKIPTYASYKTGDIYLC